MIPNKATTSKAVFNEGNSSSARYIFYGIAAFIFAGSIWWLFFFAYLIPIHSDEGGYWFNFVNKAFANRAIPQPQIPNHTISIYFAKLSLAWFGYNGIGLRFPVIFFGILDAILLFFFSRHVFGSTLVAIVSACLLMLLPWFAHYSHELRGYPPYIFFSLTGYFAIHLLLIRGNKIKYWVLLLLSFLGCYYSSLGSIVFIFNLTASLWALKLLQLFIRKETTLSPFGTISFKTFLMFSVIAMVSLLYIMFIVDPYLINQNKAYQIIANVNSTFILARDIFSTFLGGHYLDDPDSETLLYRYPPLIYFFSVGCFFYGLISSWKQKRVWAIFFVVLYLSTILFAAIMGHLVQTRAVAGMLPLVIIFQGAGLVGMAEFFFSKIPKPNLDTSIYYALSLVLMAYFLLFSSGKFQNLNASSGNPFELTRKFLEKNTGPDDLIILSTETLRETIGGFYLGDLIRAKIQNIYNDKKIESIYFLTANVERSNPGTLFDNNLSKFEKVAFFFNDDKAGRGVRIHILKAKVSTRQSLVADAEHLAKLDFYVPGHFSCEKDLKPEGLMLSCNQKKVACINHKIDINIDTGDYNLILFNHLNKWGTGHLSMAGFYPLESDQGFHCCDEFNKMILDIMDLDKFRENVQVYGAVFQKPNPNFDMRFCMSGDLFHKNSLIKGTSIVSFRFQ